MMTKRILLEMREDQKQIKKLLDPSIIEKARKYDEFAKYLKDFKLSVSKVSESTDENGYPQVIVIYEPIVEKVSVEGDERVFSSNRFKSINFLNLISITDMKKISTAIEKAKKVK